MTDYCGTLVLDIDGTLFHWVDDAEYDYEDADAIIVGQAPFIWAKLRVREAVEAGWKIIALTGRSEAASRATDHQLRKHFPDIDTVHHIGPFPGWDAYQRRKASKLAGMGHGVYVGDLEMDRLVAEAAGWEFVDAVDWRMGADLSALLPAMEAT